MAQSKNFGGVCPCKTQHLENGPEEYSQKLSPGILSWSYKESLRPAQPEVEPGSEHKARQRAGKGGGPGRAKRADKIM